MGLFWGFQERLSQGFQSYLYEGSRRPLCRTWSWFFHQLPVLAAWWKKTKNVQNNIFLYEKLAPPSRLLWFVRYDKFCAPSNCELVTLERHLVQWRTGTTNLKIQFKRALFFLSFGIWCSYAAKKSSVWKKSRFKKNLITEIHATKATAACNISEGVVVESGLFARQLRMIMVKTHKHFIFTHREIVIQVEILEVILCLIVTSLDRW